MLEYSRPSLPLTRDAFRRALRTGHGRAYQHVDAHGAAEFRDDIFEAATNCLVYDPQVEGLRASWLAKLCRDAEVVPLVIASPFAGSHRDRELRCALLKQFVLQGFSDAHQALYDCCVRAEQSGDVFACYEIISLDGADGLRFVAARLGQFAEDDPAFRVPDEPIWQFDQTHGDGAASALLATDAKGDARIARYLSCLAAEHANTGSPTPRARKTAYEVSDAIASSTRRLFYLTHWGRHASQAELGAVLRFAAADQAPLVVENALRCLSGSKDLPFQPQLLPLLQHPEPEVRRFCARTLGKHAHLDVRNAGLAALPSEPRLAIELLRINALAEDEGPIAEALRPSSDPDEQHDLVYSVVDLLEDNPHLRSVPIATYAYEESPCMECRARAARKMIDWDECPAWIVHEARFDAFESVRELFDNANGTA